MSTTMRIAPTVEELANAEPVEIERLHINFGELDELTDDIAQLSKSLRDLGRISSFTFTEKVNIKNLHRIFPWLRHPQTARAGYRITNKRGRRKLVEAKS